MDTAVWVSILSSGCGFYISLGSKSSNPFPYLIFLEFTLLILPILFIQRRISLRDLLCSFFLLCRWRCHIIILWIAGQKLSPSLSLSSEDWMSASPSLGNFIILWMELTLSPLEGFLVEVPLHSDGLCTLQFPRYFPPVSLLRKFHVVSFQFLILDSMSPGLVFFFVHVRFSLEYSPCVFLVLESIELWSLLLVLFLRFWISACRFRIFSSL